MSSPAYFVGCPLWASPLWRGKFFTADAQRDDYLSQYAAVFGTAEGNSTFYGLPQPETVARWEAEAPGMFRFCMKFPRTISHDRQLVDAGPETEEFLARLAPLGGKLGPFFLQLHASFGPDRLKILDHFLRELPRNFSYAVEVRHPEFFDHGPGEQRLDALLAERGVDRVLFDTRGLFASSATDSLTLDAKRKKPRVPLRRTVTAKKPFIRFVGDPVVERSEASLRAWASIVADWISQGLTPFVFLHHPDDVFAPRLGRLFQQFLHEINPALPAPPSWPIEKIAASKLSPDHQLELF